MTSPLVVFLSQFSSHFARRCLWGGIQARGKIRKNPYWKRYGWRKIRKNPCLITVSQELFWRYKRCSYKSAKRGDASPSGGWWHTKPIRHGDAARTKQTSRLVLMGEVVFQRMPRSPIRTWGQVRQVIVRAWSFFISSLSMQKTVLLSKIQTVLIHTF